MVVGRQIHEGRENIVVRVFCDRYCIDASSGGWIDLEDSIARLVLRGRDVRQKYVGTLRRILAERFSYMFECLAE